MTKTTAAPLADLTGEQALTLLRATRTARALILAIIEFDLAAQGHDPDTTTVLHPRNEEYLELADLEADLNELLADLH